MDLYEYLCFILLTTVCYIDADFILTEKEYTWSRAKRVCTLATPNLTFSESGITPDLDIRPSADAWLGYIENMTSFEYFGCANKNDLGLATTSYYTTTDPGKCWSACNDGSNVEAIAVNGKKCYCLHTVIADESDLKENNCNKGCPGQPKIVCGNGRNHVSLYKTTDTGTIQASLSENSICLWYNIIPQTFHWGNCSENYSIICYKGVEVSLIDYYGDWITMTIECFRKDKKPSNYNNTQNVNTNKKIQMWTGITRNGVIYPITDPANVNIGKYGYVGRTTRLLLFTNDDTVRKRAFCVKGTTTEDTTDENKTGSSDVGAIVGATVAIIIVIIVVLVLVVLWKRGMKFPFKKARKLERKKTQATNMTYNIARPDNTIQGTAESTFNDYAEVDVSKMTPGSGVTQTGNANRTSDSSDEPHTYIVFEKGNKGTYDTTKTTPQIHDQHTLNPYNEISLEESSNYDHIGAHVNRTMQGQYLDHNLQNDHGVTNIAFNSNDECDDTYNHIGDLPGQND